MFLSMRSEWTNNPYVKIFYKAQMIFTDHVLKRLPPKEEYVKVAKPDWAATANRETWARDIKATWLGHACFLVELPAPKDSKTSEDIQAPARGPRILFDPVFSHRCSPSQLIGPARYTPPPMPLKELPYVDAVILSHNHYDHTCVYFLHVSSKLVFDLHCSWQ